MGTWYKNIKNFTNLEKRLKRGDPGINPLDQAAKEHDNFYLTHKDTSSRYIADERLENKAWRRVTERRIQRSQKK